MNALRTSPIGDLRAQPTIGYFQGTLACRRRKSEARALMHLGLVEYGARMRLRPLSGVPDTLRSIADELDVIGMRLAYELEMAA